VLMWHTSLSKEMTNPMLRKARGFFLAFYFKPFYLSEWFDE